MFYYKILNNFFLVILFNFLVPTINIENGEKLFTQNCIVCHIGGSNVIIFEKNQLIFIFNFSPTNSIFNYQFTAPEKGTYRILLNSDKKSFGGFDRVDENIDYPTDQNQQVSIYLTNRTAMVLTKK
jgi:1,4-alpha-glucan branching enzyme